MTSIVVKRGPRMAGPTLTSEQLQLAEPPLVGEPAPLDFGSAMSFMPMLLGGGAMALVFSIGAPSPALYLTTGMMGLSMMSMSLMQVVKPPLDRRRKMRGERRDYLRYLDQMREQARAAADSQRAALQWDNPEVAALWWLADGPRLWERRAGHDDFARVRIGRGEQRAALEPQPPMTRPIEDLEPLCAVALRRFTRAFATVPGLPIAVGLRRFTAVEFAGEVEHAAGLLRALLAQLVVLHSPDELRVALLAGPDTRAQWEWCKWLPHVAHPVEVDDGGPVRIVAGSEEELFAMIGPGALDRPDHDPDATPSPTEPFTVVIAHGLTLPTRSRLRGGGLRNVVLLDLTGELPGGDEVLRLTVTDGRVEFPSGDSTGSAVPDTLDIEGAERLARTLAPLRTSGTVELSSKPLESDFELTELLNIRNPRTFDVQAAWRPRAALRARLQVPIGVTEDGEVVELDLKEAAQGGMGPHGVLIGATGSGKSELLRTLVIGLAATHSSEVLNMVLVDFKGGATFLGTEKLPHTSAVITNLVDELPLVDRMQDSINGELVRRQELLRAAGYSSLYDYEKARAGGAILPPLPTLLVIVDEFSELLTAKPEFMDLFVQIGRLGRSLGVHLLLASQRLDEGRIHRVEGHLSYRIALRTFSSMESRSVIGVTSAYELPSAPGNGYVKIDTENLVRFKAAYVSGPCTESRQTGTGGLAAATEIAAFRLEPGRIRRVEQSDDALPSPRVVGESAGDDEDSLLDVLIERLEGAGPSARQVWLPPLSESPGLDQLLPGLVPDRVRGISPQEHSLIGSLTVPVGVVDRPYEQVRELLTADLTGGQGNVGVVGAPQSGKSSLLRTLVLALALTHTPREVQFYCLDLAGGGLSSLAAMPHVGSIASRLERDRVIRTVEEIAQVLEWREQAFSTHRIDSMVSYRALAARGELPAELRDHPFGDVFLVVDGWQTLRKDYEDLEPRITEFAARGLAYGVHVVVAATRWSEIRLAIRDLLGTRFELRLGDPIESELGARVAALVPAQPGRGLTTGKFHFLAALPRIDGGTGGDDLASATRAAADELAAHWPGRRAPEVRMLPARLPASALPPAQLTRAGDLRVTIGLDEKRLEPVVHDFGTVPHMLVLGDAETGKTTMLRTVARAVVAAYGPTEAKILLADSRRELVPEVPDEYRIGFAVGNDSLADLAANAAVSLDKRLPGSDVTPEQLSRRDWWSGPRLFVLIDDYDLLSSSMGMAGPLEPLVRLLAQGPAIGLHVVIARSTSGSMRAMMDPMLRRMWELGAPAVLFSYPKEEGKFIGEAKPRTLPPGRAQLVTRRGVGLIQTMDSSLDAVPAAETRHPVPTGARA